jgi:hypothetical protein
MRAPIDTIAMLFWGLVRLVGRLLRLPILSQYALVKRIHIERKQK